MSGQPNEYDALIVAAEAWYAALVEQGVLANGTPRLLELGAALREADAALDTVVS